MGSSYDKRRDAEYALKREVAEQRGFLRLGTPSVRVAREIVDLSQDLGREVGVDLESILGMFKQSHASQAADDKIVQVVFLARSLAKMRAARQGSPTITV